MSEEERQKHIEERNARGVARKAERQGAKARMEQVRRAVAASLRVYREQNQGRVTWLPGRRCPIVCPASAVSRPALALRPYCSRPSPLLHHRRL